MEDAEREGSVDSAEDVGSCGEDNVSKQLLAALVILCCVGSWIVMGELLQESDLTTRAPALFSCVTQSSYAVFLPVAMLLADSPGSGKIWRDLKLSGPLALLWYASIWLWYLSLTGMSVAANTVIFQSSCIFVYLLSIVFLDEQLELRKVLGVLVAISGVGLICVSKDKERGVHEKGFSYVFCFLATFCYALFEVFYDMYFSGHGAGGKTHNTSEDERVMPERSTSSMLDGETAHLPVVWRLPILCLEFPAVALSLGLRGLWILAGSAPMLVVLNASRVESWQAPALRDCWTLMLVTLCDWVFNVAFLMGIAVFRPLWVTMALILVVPASLVTDTFCHALRVTFLGWMGTALVLGSFLLINLPDQNFVLYERVDESSGSDNPPANSNRSVRSVRSLSSHRSLA
mmetsp:Transcript_97820/g.276718  ORF Transcript_97820/g.276718 Transcript_97820/m.276718 type:complete len:403 (+) Transcript_97820:127-1335(+)